MKVIGFMPLHYGAPYLDAAIESIADRVDEMWILYSARPSHNGSRFAALPNPDSRADLYAIAAAAAGHKLRWVDGDWAQEHEQRNAIYTLCPDADVILCVDSDEVWCSELITVAIQGYDIAREKGWRSLRVPFIHFWRSFHLATWDDGQKPTRVFFPKVVNEGADSSAFVPVHLPHVRLHVCHFGYAVPVRYMQYKWAGGHGHQAELRPDFMQKYINNDPVDCHPVSRNFWYPERVDPAIVLPLFMRSHPYWGKQVIE